MHQFGTIAQVWSADLVYLRPLGGGLEWTARPRTIRPALTSELLALRVAADRKARLALCPDP